jgi:hypothetical protein
MKIEKEIALYLKTYGNTREADLINYGVQHFCRRPEEMKKVLDRMVIKGKIFRVVHQKLKPPEVYVSLDEQLPSFDVSVGLSEAVVKAEAHEILREAAAVAERRTSEKGFGKE